MKWQENDEFRSITEKFWRKSQKVFVEKEKVENLNDSEVELFFDS